MYPPTCNWKYKHLSDQNTQLLLSVLYFLIYQKKPYNQGFSLSLSFQGFYALTSKATHSTWFVVSLFAVMILGNLPPLSMIEGAFLKYFGIPVAFTWFMSTKTFDGKKPYGFLKSVIAYALRRKLTYAGKKVTLGRNQPQEAITAVRSEFYGISN